MVEREAQQFEDIGESRLPGLPLNGLSQGAGRGGALSAGAEAGEGEGKLRENEECRIEGGGERPVRERLGCGAMAVRVERLACTGRRAQLLPKERRRALRESLGWLVKVEVRPDGRCAARPSRRWLQRRGAGCLAGDRAGS